MYSLAVLIAPLSLLLSLVHAHSTAILYWPISSPQPSPFARVSYDPTSQKSTVSDYRAPAAHDTDALTRIGFYTPTDSNPKQWVGSLTSLNSLVSTDTHRPMLRLHLDSRGEVYHVSVAQVPKQRSAETESEGPSVEFVPTEDGPKPQLNRPVAVGPDGKNTEEVEEKSFVQK